jgi:hypothetical protein
MWPHTWQLSSESFFGLVIGVVMLPYMPTTANEERSWSDLRLAMRD